jgi:hypothetical protein
MNKMELIFNRPVKVNRERQEFAEKAVRVASLIQGISPAPVEFFVVTSPSRDPDLLTTQGRALGFCREGTIFLRSNLKPADLVKTAFHESRHIKQIATSRQTLKVTFSLEADERDSRLFTYEYLSDLKDSATRAECLEFLNQLEKRQSQKLREKFAPVLERMSRAYASRLKSGGLKISGIIEYR